MSEDVGTVPAWLDVSRETLERLQELAALVRKWTPRINLVAKSTVPDLWHRHILDSAQIFRFVPAAARRWADLGSGGGFPALVVAILAKPSRPDLQFVLMESDRRKSVFLMEASRLLQLNVSVLAMRTEDASAQNADIVSARALAPLDVLCGQALRHMAGGGLAIFPKGAMAEQEVAVAREHWSFDVDLVASVTEQHSKILLLRNIRHV